MELKVIQTSASFLIQQLRKNTGLSMILEKSDYWASCKATLIPCFVILELMPADTVLGGTGDTAGGKGPRVSWPQSLSLVRLLSHCQHAPVWPAPCESQWCTLQLCRPQRQLSQVHWHPNP